MRFTLAVIAERLHAFTGASIEGLQPVAGGNQNAAIAAILVLPAGDAAMVHVGARVTQVVLPDFPACGGLTR